MIQDIVNKLAVRFCVPSADVSRMVKEQYRVLLHLYPYADRPYLKRNALYFVEHHYKKKKSG